MCKRSDDKARWARVVDAMAAAGRRIADQQERSREQAPRTPSTLRVNTVFSHLHTSHPGRS